MVTNEQADELYLNIGTDKSCLFVRMSRFVLKRLQQYPLLYFSVEEALECAKIGYYGIGIMAFAQLLNLLSESTPDERHLVSHKFLEWRPSKQSFDAIVDEFKTAAANVSARESARVQDIGVYNQIVLQEWKDFIKQLHNLNDFPAVGR